MSSGIVKLALKVAKRATVLPQYALYLLKNRFGKSPVVGAGQVDVSLTTYSTRAKWVYLAIESIASGGVKPRRLILWIDDEDILGSLPKSVRRLQRRGLEVRSTINYGPHKKYYSYVECQDVFAVPLVTADDDIIYPTFWLERLIDSYSAFPDSISCFRAHTIRMDDGSIAPYRTWQACDHSRPSYLTFSTGASGALYPPDFLHSLKTRGTLFLDVAPKADDVWLHATAVASGFSTRQLESAPREFPVIPGSQHLALSRHNVILDGNDQQIQLAYQSEQLKALLRS